MKQIIHPNHEGVIVIYGLGVLCLIIFLLTFLLPSKDPENAPYVSVIAACLGIACFVDARLYSKCFIAFDTETDEVTFKKPIGPAQTVPIADITSIDMVWGGRNRTTRRFIFRLNGKTHKMRDIYGDGGEEVRAWNAFIREKLRPALSQQAQQSSDDIERIYTDPRFRKELGVETEEDRKPRT